MKRNTKKIKWTVEIVGTDAERIMSASLFGLQLLIIELLHSSIFGSISLIYYFTLYTITILSVYIIYPKV